MEPNEDQPKQRKPPEEKPRRFTPEQEERIYQNMSNMVTESEWLEEWERMTFEIFREILE